MTAFRIWAGGGHELAEGTRWLGDRLVFTDILAGALLAAPGDAPGDARVLASLGMPLGAVAPVAGKPGEWIAAAGTGIAIRRDDRPVHPDRFDADCHVWSGSVSRA